MTPIQNFHSPTPAILKVFDTDLRLRIQRASRRDGDSMNHVADCDANAQYGNYMTCTLKYLEHCLLYEEQMKKIHAGSPSLLQWIHHHNEHICNSAQQP